MLFANSGNAGPNFSSISVEPRTVGVGDAFTDPCISMTIIRNTNIMLDRTQAMEIVQMICEHFGEAVPEL